MGAGQPELPTLPPGPDMSSQLGQTYDREPYQIPADVALSIANEDTSRTGAPLGYEALFEDPHFRSQHRLTGPKGPVRNGGGVASDIVRRGGR